MHGSTHFACANMLTALSTSSRYIRSTAAPSAGRPEDASSSDTCTASSCTWPSLYCSCLASTNTSRHWLAALVGRAKRSANNLGVLEIYTPDPFAKSEVKNHRIPVCQYLSHSQADPISLPDLYDEHPSLHLYDCMAFVSRPAARKATAASSCLRSPSSVSPYASMTLATAKQIQLVTHDGICCLHFQNSSAPLIIT